MRVPCGGAEGESRASLPASGAASSAWHLLACRHITHASVCLDMQCPLFRACPNPVWPALNFITFAMTLFPNKVTFRGTGA